MVLKVALPVFQLKNTIHGPPHQQFPYVHPRAFKLLSLPHILWFRDLFSIIYMVLYYPPHTHTHFPVSLSLSGIGLLADPNYRLAQCEQGLPLVAEQGPRTLKSSTDPFPLSSSRTQAPKARSRPCLGSSAARLGR